MIAGPVVHASTRRSIIEASREEARALRIRFGLELSERELELRRRQLCQKPAPKFNIGVTFVAHLRTSKGEMIERECKIVEHHYSFSRQWGHTLFYELDSGAQVLAEQIERAMNPALARPKILDYCEDCE